MIIVFFVLIITIILLSEIKISIKNLTINNKEVNFLIKIGIYLFGKIRIIGFTINENKIKRIKIIKKINKRGLLKRFFINRKKVNLSQIPYDLEKFNLKIKLGVEDACITSYIVGILSTIIGVLLGNIIKKYDNEKYYYIVIPNYNGRNTIDLEFNCIIYLKMVHIIHAIFIIKRKRSDNKNDRTSNRRTYDYSYG